MPRPKARVAIAIATVAIGFAALLVGHWLFTLLATFVVIGVVWRYVPPLPWPTPFRDRLRSASLFLGGLIGFGYATVAYLSARQINTSFWGALPLLFAGACLCFGGLGQLWGAISVLCQAVLMLFEKDTNAEGKRRP
jgi:Zn-dependent protease with chaperone function